MDADKSHRLFLGISIPTNHLETFDELRQLNSAASGVRWVRETNLHITVYFFGKVWTEQMGNLASLLQVGLQDQPPFPLYFRNYQFAPKPQSPRMIWARYEKSEVFNNLVQNIRQLYQQIEPELQFRLKPKPHITLARLKSPVLESIDLKTIRSPSVPIEVKELVLWESVLKPEGSVYVVRKKFGLQ